MLMKWAQVSPEGEFTEPPKSQLSYGALLVGRVAMVSRYFHIYFRLKIQPKM